MLGLSFGEPWSLALILVLVPWWALLRLEARRRARADSRYGGAPELRLGRRRRLQRLRTWSLVAAVVLFVLAIARPQWGSEDAPAERRGVDIAIALDVSRSMTTSDVLPSRSVAAAEGVGEFLTHLRSDRVGLVIFSGRAFARSPLTLDLEVLGQLVNQAQRDAELVPAGTDLGAAIDEARAVLAVPDAAESQVIIVISDGEDLGEAALAAAARAANDGIPVFTVAVGTDAGAAIPGDAATLAISRADRETLRAIATATGGDFRELNAIAGLAIEVQRLRQSEFGDDTGQQPIERFQWFLVPAVLLLLLPMVVGEAAGRRSRVLTRRHLGATAILGTLLLGACGGSQLYQLVADGNAAYDQAFYDEALIEYRDALLASPGEPAVGYNVGNTLNRLRRYEEASVAAGDALTRVDDNVLAALIGYALGNHAVARGALEEARRHYIGVLRIDPDDAEAKANLEWVLARLQPPDVGTDNPDEPTSTPEATPEPGDSPGAADGEPPGDNEPGEDGPEPGEQGDGPGEQPSQQPDGQSNPGEPTPAAGSDQPGTEPGSDTPGTATDDPGGALTLEQAQAALEQALQDLQGDLTLEEAAQLLELIRQLSAVEPLDGVGSSRGGFGDR